MQHTNTILQTAAATLLVLISLLLLRHLKQVKHLWAGIGFTLSVLCYLIIDTPFAHDPFVRVFVLTGSICIPVFFWLLSKSIFEDHFRFTPSLLLWFLVPIVPHLHHYPNCNVDLPKPVT